MFAEWIPGYVYGPNVAFEELQEFVNFCIDTRMPKTNNIIHKYRIQLSKLNIAATSLKR